MESGQPIGNVYNPLFARSIMVATFDLMKPSLSLSSRAKISSWVRIGNIKIKTAKRKLLGGRLPILVLYCALRNLTRRTFHHDGRR